MSEAIRSIDPGTVNIGLCDFSPADNKILRWTVFSAATIEALFSALDERPFEGRVVIEAQSKRTSKMLSVQNFLHAYYVLKGLKVTIFSARHKLKDSGQENKGKGNYRARKKASVAIVSQWLQDHPQDPAITAWFSQCKKKDDAADSALQAFAYVRLPIAALSASKSGGVKIICRAPTTRQQRTGRYSQSNLKHIIAKDWMCEDQKALADRLPADKKVAKAVQRQFGTEEECWRRLFPA